MLPTAIITGASGGIGQACARSLSTDHNIILHYHQNHKGVKALASEITEDNNWNGDIMTIQCDMSDPSSINNMIDSVFEQFDNVDVLVNNAGLGPIYDLSNLTPQHIERTLSVNLKGVIYCSMAVVDSMREQQSGRIVNVASSAGIHGSPTDPIYAASKGGLIAFTKTLARLFTSEGIFANVVAPGPTATAMIPPERRTAAIKPIPLNRLIKPEEVADVVRFFSTTTAVSGKVLEIDGGRDT